MYPKFQHKEALWSLWAQVLVIMIFFPIVAYGVCVEAALSMLVGGLVCFLPNLYLYRRVFSFFGATQSKLIVRALYWGETVKIILTVLFFVVALLIPWALPMWIFIGYISAQVGFWAAPIYIGLKK